MAKKSRQRLEYLENEKSFEDEIKTIFHYFRRAIIEANKFFFQGESPTLKINLEYVLKIIKHI